MHFLIIEDDQNKVQKVSAFVSETFANATISQARSYQTGLKEVIRNLADLILLDMSMPTYDVSPFEDGGRPRIFAGREILYYMKSHEIEKPVLILTQFETFGEGEEKISFQKLKNKLLEEFAGIFLGMVFYNTTNNSWKDEIAAIIKNSCFQRGEKK
jgi:CheY-like chemotaxis protein